MSEKLRIRVINTQSLDQGEAPKAKSEEPKPKVVVEYYWNRIIAASILIVALLAGLIWGGAHVFNRSGDNPSAATGQAAKPMEPASTPHVEIRVSEPSKPKDSVKAVDNAIKPSPQEPALAGMVDGKMLPGTQPEGIAVPPAQSSPKSVAESSANLTIAILSSNIKRIQFTSGVSEDGPVDNIGQTITMNAKGLIRVYLFMETDGLKGKVLFHDWYWKGKRIAHARIPIKRNNHTAASSKFIDRIMMGPWEVKIVDSSNRVLAKADFEVH